ncbi:hypothetical protein [uncultured Flavobacterium sp.]|uniref:hypothetical protein n=1 Tax=uncultured Flavobacterium sp. TaxID=165435 RepID=UPI0030CA3FC1
MKTNYLFPNYLKKSSGIILLLSFFALILIPIINENGRTLKLEINVFAIFFNEGLTVKSIGWTKEDILQEIIGIILILSGLMFAFSKEKTEDEMISKIRVESLVWAMYVNYAVLIFCILFIYGLSFLSVMIYNMITLLFSFIIRFHWMIYRNNKIYNYDE